MNELQARKLIEEYNNELARFREKIDKLLTEINNNQSNYELLNMLTKLTTSFQTRQLGYLFNVFVDISEELHNINDSIKSYHRGKGLGPL